MKAYRLFFIFIFLVLPIYASNEKPLPSPVREKIGEKQGVSLSYWSSNTWIIGLGDGSYWKIQPLESKPDQTWYEWWHGITPISWNLDDVFFFDHHDWDEIQEMQIYHADGSYFDGYNHIGENVASGQKAFIQFLPYGEAVIPKIEYIEEFLKNPLGEPIQILKNESFMAAHLILSDKTIWRLQCITQNDEPCWFWWSSDNDYEQPDTPFVFDLYDWKKGEEIQIYRYPMDEKHKALNQLYGASDVGTNYYLIENQTRNQLAFAQQRNIVEFARAYEYYAREQWDDGYSSGYSSGYNDGVSAGRSENQ